MPDILNDGEQRFGKVELGPENAPEYGRVLWERSMSGTLVKRFTLDSQGWSTDVKTGQKSWRVENDSAFLPDGRQVATWFGSGAPAPKPDPAHQLFGAPSPPKAAGGIDALEAQVNRWKAPAPKPSAAQRLFGKGK